MNRPTEMGHPDKGIYVPKRYIVAGIIVVAIVIALALGFFGQTGQLSTQGTQTATSGGGSPAGPAGPATVTPTVVKPTETPKTETVTFEQLVEKWKTPEDIQTYMQQNFKYRYGPARMPYSPDELLLKKEGDYSDFTEFFGRSLTSKGCWNGWDARIVSFRLLYQDQEGRDISASSGRIVVVFRDTDGQYKYMVPQPPDFPIYTIGASSYPIPLEEKRLSARLYPGTYTSTYVCS